MTLEEAKAIYYINIEIKRIKRDLLELEQSRQFYKPVNLSGMPRGSPSYLNTSDQYLEKRYKLDMLLNLKLRKLEQKKLEFEEWLESVADPQMRLILRLRCINNMTWEEIGEEMNYHRTGLAKKFYQFFEEQSQDSHNSH